MLSHKTSNRYLAILLSIVVALLTVFAGSTSTVSAATKWKVSLLLRPSIPVKQ